MSATANIEAFRSYLADKCSLPTGIVKLDGAPKDIVRIYTDKPVQFYDVWVVKMLYKLLGDPGLGDVLVFCPGVPEIRQVHERLRTMAHDRPDRCRFMEVVELYRDSPDMLANTLQKMKHVDLDGYRYSVRRVILCTNIAETSLTFDDLTHVIECGYYKRPLFSAVTGTYMTETLKCDQAQILQRVGRVGRKTRGIVLHAYTEDEYRDRPAHAEVDTITRVDFDAPLFTVLTHPLVRNDNVGIEQLQWISEL